MLSRKSKYPLPPYEKTFPLQQEDESFEHQPAGILDGIGGAIGGSLAAGALSKILMPDSEPVQEEVTPQTADLNLINKNDLEHASKKKAALTAMGGIGDALANQQSWGNFYLGKMNPHQDVSGTMDKLAQRADDPIHTKEKLQKEALLAPELRYMKDAINKDSDLSKMSSQLNAVHLEKVKNTLFKNNPAVQQAIQSFQDKLPNLSAYEVDKMMSSSGLKDLAKETMSSDRIAGMLYGANNRLIGQAQQIINRDPLLNTYTQRLDGAQKILNLIDAAKTGDVKSNQALLGQLNAEISRLETGSQTPGLHASEKTEMQDLKARYQNIKDTITGDVTNVDLGKKFEQATAMVQDLGGSYYDQMEKRHQMLSSGALDSQQPTFEAKRNSFQNSYSGFSPLSRNQRKSTPPKSTPEGDTYTKEDVQKYAKLHNVSIERAKAALKKVGHVQD
jgi:hypothetical protein